jgi:hypothetical protein
MMTRSDALYANGSKWTPPEGYGFDVDVPLSGFYRMKLRSGAIFVGIHIWFGEPLEPWTREPMQRGPRWNAECNGRYIELEYVWPKCADSPCDEAEYQYLSSLQAWGKENAPNSPQAKPHTRINLLNAPINL